MQNELEKVELLNLMVQALRLKMPQEYLPNIKKVKIDDDDWHANLEIEVYFTDDTDETPEYSIVCWKFPPDRYDTDNYKHYGYIRINAYDKKSNKITTIYDESVEYTKEAVKERRDTAIVTHTELISAKEAADAVMEIFNRKDEVMKRARAAIAEQIANEIKKQGNKIRIAAYWVQEWPQDIWDELTALGYHCTPDDGNMLVDWDV